MLALQSWFHFLCQIQNLASLFLSLEPLKNKCVIFKENPARSRCSLVFSVAQAPPPPVTLRHRGGLSDDWLNHQLQQAGWFRHLQLRHPVRTAVRSAQQSQRAGGDPGVGSPQPSPVHPEVVGRPSVRPAQGGVEVQEGDGRVGGGASAPQPSHVAHVQALDLLRRHLQAGCIQELGERRCLGGYFVKSDVIGCMIDLKIKKLINL